MKQKIFCEKSRVITYARKNRREKEVGKVLKDMHSRLSKPALVSFVMNCSGTLLTFLLALILARLLGASGYGVYAEVLAVVTICIPFAVIGIDFLFVRFVSAYSAKEEHALLKGLLYVGLKTVILTSLFIGFLLSIAAVALPTLSNQLRHGLILGAVLIPLLSLLGIMQSALQGLKKIALSQISINIVRPSVTVVAVILLSLFIGITSTIALTVLVIFTAISLVLSTIFLYKLIYPKIAHVFPSYKKKYWLATALPLLLLSGAYVIITQIDILMIGSMINASAAGIYAASVKIATIVLFGMGAVGTIFGPLVAELYHLKKLDEIKRLVHQGILLSMIFSIPVALLLIIGRRQILDLFGVEFGVGSAALVILIIGQLFNTSTGPIAFVLTMTGHQKHAAKILWFATGGNIILNILLIPYFGIVGAAIASMITTITWNLAMVIYVKKALKINIFTPSKPKTKGISTV